MIAPWRGHTLRWPSVSPFLVHFSSLEYGQKLWLTYSQRYVASDEMPLLRLYCSIRLRVSRFEPGTSLLGLKSRLPWWERTCERGSLLSRNWGSLWEPGAAPGWRLARQGHQSYSHKEQNSVNKHQGLKNNLNSRKKQLNKHFYCSLLRLWAKKKICVNYACITNWLKLGDNVYCFRYLNLW